MDLFAQGKRHLFVNDIKAAVESLQEASRMLAEQHGETSPECGDVYFYYGRALLDMARIESDVLGNALDGVPEGDDLENSQVENPDKMTEEEKEKVSNDVDEALQENTSKKSSPSDDETEEDETEDEETEGDEAEEDSAMDTDAEKKDESKEKGDKDGEEDLEEGDKKDEEDEDVSNHQLAWEMLELAKVIYQKQADGDKAMSIKTAQVFLKLGEVGLESETYPQPIEDFQACLKIQEKHMEADDRCLAETHYQLGVAYSFSDDFDKSIASFSKALKIIEDRITNLKKVTSPTKGSKKTPSKSPGKDAKETDSADSVFEIKELDKLVPEIKEKIDDMEEMKKDAKDKINKVKKEIGKANAIGGNDDCKTNAFGSSNDSSEAKTIETKKRKPEDEAKSDLKKKAAVDMENKTKELKKQAK